MKQLLLCCLVLAVSACVPGRRIPAKDTPLDRILTAHAGDFAPILDHPETYEVQIIYTQINRDAAGRPYFTTYRYQVDSTRYFYPASVVKMPVALLALEKINRLRASGYPRIDRNTAYRLDSLRPFQQPYAIDSTAPGNKPSIAHDIRKIFTVSDNAAFNHLFEFLGRASINNSLQAKGYTRTGIVHRLSTPDRDNRYSSPMVLYDAAGTIFKEKEQMDDRIRENPQTGLRKGKGYYLGDSLVKKPFDFRARNWFALTDMERMLRAVIFPEATPVENRFALKPDDYQFLWHYMGIFPRACDYPRYDTAEYYDGYVKFFLFGDGKERRNGSVRVFNKVGEAYGTLTDVAYVVDFEHHTEFILAATILCNRDGIFNDDQYEYDTVGFPFLAKLGRAIQEFEQKRPRAHVPDLSRYRAAIDTQFNK